MSLADSGWQTSTWFENILELLDLVLAGRKWYELTNNDLKDVNVLIMHKLINRGDLIHS